MTKKTTTKKKLGRPKEAVADKVDFNQVALLCDRGFTDKDLARFYGVNEGTINNWKKDPAFLQVLKSHKENADENVKKSLYQRAIGYWAPDTKIMQHDGVPIEVDTLKYYAPDVTACIFWLKNRQPLDWRDKQDVEHSGEIKTNTIAELLNAWKQNKTAFKDRDRGLSPVNTDGLGSDN